MLIIVPIPATQFLVYAAASRLLRPLLGPKAPAPVDLITRELTNRRAKTIAEEYLEAKGYPTLTVFRRNIAAKRAVIKRKSHDKSRAARRVIARAMTEIDPSRN